MIETLKAQLHLALRRQFGPRNEYVNVNQIGLFAGEADGSTVIEVLEADAERSASAGSDEQGTPEKKIPATRKKAVRILKNLPKDVRFVDIAEADKVCAARGSGLCARHQLDGERSVLNIDDHAPAFRIDRNSAPIDAAIMIG